MKYIPPTSEERFFLARLDDLIRRAEGQYFPQFTSFLGERQKILAQQYIGNRAELQFYGGYPEAQRVIAMISSENDFSENAEGLYPLECLKIKWNASGQVNHRDVLGSLMGLGIERERIGDILIDQEEALVFCHSSICSFLEQNLLQIGKNSVSVSQGVYEANRFAPKFDILTGTVPSLRLDCVLSLMVHMSRSKAGSLLGAKKVCVGGSEITEGSVLLEEGDIISVRGYGKFILQKIGSMTKKDRIFITVAKFK